MTAASSTPDEGTQSRRGVLAGGLWGSASQLLPLIGTTLLSVTLARKLGAADLGLQSYISYVEAVLATLLVGALTATAVRSLASDAERGPALAWWTLVSHAATSVLIAVVLACVGLARRDELELWLIAALSALASGCASSYAARRVAAEGYARISRYRLLSQSLAAGLGIAAVLAGGGIAGVLWANVVGAALLLLLARRGVPGPRPRRGPLPPGLRRLWLSFLGIELITQVVSRRIEFFILDAYSTTTEIALYSVPFMVVTSVTVGTSGIFLAAMPAVARHQAAGRLDAVSAALGRAFRICLALAVPLTVAVAAVGPRLVEVVYGREFERAADLVPLMALVVLVTPLSQLCASYWAGVGRLRILLVCGSIGGAVDLALAFALIPDRGAAGAAVANVCGQGVAAVLLAVSTWRAAGRFPVGGRTLLAALPGSLGALGAAVLVLRALDGVPGLLVAAAVTTVVLLANGRFVGYLGPHDGAWLGSALPARLAGVLPLLRGRSSAADEASVHTDGDD